MFWTCITAKGPGYGTTIIEGSINSSLYVEILQSSLKDTLDYYELDSKHARSQRDKATPHRSTIAKKLFPNVVK
jgi:hypothetical protein